MVSVYTTGFSEPIIHRFVELCVDMRKGRTAKEGLMQYKNIAQNTSVASIESVITRFVHLADDKVREAQEKAAVQVAVDVDDLEASEMPESILLGAVSSVVIRVRIKWIGLWLPLGSISCGRAIALHWRR